MKLDKKQKIKRIKESITYNDYKKIIGFVKIDETIRDNSRVNLLRAFCILYYTGLRVNELQEMRLHNIQDLISTGETKIALPKTSNERKLFASKDFQRELKSLFADELAITNNNHLRIIAKSSSNASIQKNAFINKVNSKMREVLGDGYTSHSFRQGIISEMAAKGVNIKIISKFIAHSDIKTTALYVKPTDDDIKNAMIR
ncbi:site-specific integrase [Aliarcobacter cryaerophilus]|nr:site-specific integrase [Aliarcobacter cryaerophilus]